MKVKFSEPTKISDSQTLITMANLVAGMAPPQMGFLEVLFTGCLKV